MKRTTLPTQIIDKNGKVTTVHKAAQDHKQSRMRHNLVPPPPKDNVIIRLEQYLSEWGQEYNADPESFDSSTSEYVDTAHALTEKFGLPILGGTRAVWDMGTHVAKLAFNEMGYRANIRESQAVVLEPEIPVASCYIANSFEAPILVMEKVSEINWGETSVGRKKLDENNYPWLADVESKQAGLTFDGKVVAYDLSESWNY